MQTKYKHLWVLYISLISGNSSDATLFYQWFFHSIYFRSGPSRPGIWMQSKRNTTSSQYKITMIQKPHKFFRSHFIIFIGPHPLNRHTRPRPRMRYKMNGFWHAEKTAPSRLNSICYSINLWARLLQSRPFISI